MSENKPIDLPQPQTVHDILVKHHYTDIDHAERLVRIAKYIGWVRDGSDWNDKRWSLCIELQEAYGNPVRIFDVMQEEIARLAAQLAQLTYELDKSRDSHSKRIERLEAQLTEAKQLIEADNKYLKRLERALAYAKQTWDEHPAKSVWDAAVERLERGE